MKKRSNPIMTDIITRYIESEVTGVEKINQFENAQLVAKYMLMSR